MGAGARITAQCQIDRFILEVAGPRQAKVLDLYLAILCITAPTEEPIWPRHHQIEFWHNPAYVKIPFISNVFSS